MEQYIYTSEADELFEQKLRELHRRFVDTMVMAGAATIGTPIDKVKMSRLGHSTDYCSKIVGGFQNVKPCATARLHADETSLFAELIFTHITNDYVDDMYMIQNIYNYPETGYCLYQIWYLNKTTPRQINTLWSD